MGLSPKFTRQRYNMCFCDHDQNFLFIYLDELLIFFKKSVPVWWQLYPVLWRTVRCWVPVLPGYECSESDLFRRTARQRSQHVSDPHPSSYSNPNHHGSQHPAGREQRLGNSTIDAWRWEGTFFYTVVQNIKLGLVKILLENFLPTRIAECFFFL